MTGPVIKVEDLSKEYRLGVIGHGTMYRDLQSWWARVRGKEDPNAQIFDDGRKHGDHFMALRDISFEVQGGERLGIIGKNGAGKSTLLKILSRVTGPTSGQVKLKGRVASLLEVGTGFHGELTGRENIYLNGALLGMNRKEVSKRFDAIVEFAGVQDFIDTPVKRYSSGMYVRLGFAVAAHLEPDILIVDEVLAVGDAEFQRKCLGKMEDVSKNEGRTILFVSHNMNSVKRICNSAILLQDGKISYNGVVEEAVDNYLAEADPEQTALQWSVAGQPIQVTDVKIGGLDGRSCDRLRPGSGLHIQVVVSSDVRAENPISKVLVKYREHKMFGADTQVDGINLTLTKGVNRFEVEFPDLPLRPGKYTITWAVRDSISKAPLFGESPIALFEIEGTDADYGLSEVLLAGQGSYSVMLPYRWRTGNREYLIDIASGIRG